MSFPVRTHFQGGGKAKSSFGPVLLWSKTGVAPETKAIVIRQLGLQSVPWLSTLLN